MMGYTGLWDTKLAWYSRSATHQTCFYGLEYDLRILGLPDFAWSPRLLQSECGAIEYTNCISAYGYDSPNECPGYDNQQSDGEASVMQKLWEMQSTPLLLSPPGPLWSGMTALDRVLSIGQIEVNCVLMLNWVVWNRTVYIFGIK